MGTSDDPSVLWSGQRNNLAAVATGGRVVSARYEIRAGRIVFEAGILSSSEEFVPMWAVRDLDVRQTMTQKARRVGDVVIRLEHNDYTAKPAVTLESIPDPRAVRDLIDGLAARAQRSTCGAEHADDPTRRAASTRDGEQARCFGGFGRRRTDQAGRAQGRLRSH